MIAKVLLASLSIIRNRYLSLVFEISIRVLETVFRNRQDKHWIVQDEVLLPGKEVQDHLTRHNAIALCLE